MDIEHFKDPLLAFEYLVTTTDEIFLIISDMNMPVMTGMELKQAIDNDPILRKKSIPFIFSSTAALKEDIKKAYV